MSELNKIYLPNLNSLRAIAALMVIISHLQVSRNKISGALGNFGSLGVTIFFVLSGFLITYLLLIEKERFFKINIRDFYFRRMLRIWPLYFFLLFFVYELVPYVFPQYYTSEIDRFSIKSLLMNVFFLTNITLIIKLTPLVIRVIWSIGIEEQFYLILPWIMRCKERRRNDIIISIIFFLPFCKLLIVLYEKMTGNDSLKIISSILTVTRFDCMAIGAIFGALSFSKQIFIGKICIKYEMFTRKNTQIIVYLLFILFYFSTLFFPSLFNIINYIIYPWFFAICILNLSTNTKSILKIENKYLNYLGKISYGLYLIHELVIFLVLPFVLPFLVSFSPFIKGIITYLFVFSFTIFLSHISYYYYEIKFFKLKRRLSHLET